MLDVPDYWYRNWHEYRSIADSYGVKVAVRSGVRLINHIDEGLAIMQRRGVDEVAQRAFCIHPLVQDDADLSKNYTSVCWSHRSDVVMLAMEYRNIANLYLSMRTIESITEIALSPIEHVNEMLVADKIQNYKDFLIYHKGTHPRSDALDQYFQNWLDRLDIPMSVFNEYKYWLMLQKLDLSPKTRLI